MSEVKVELIRGNTYTFFYQGKPYRFNRGKIETVTGTMSRLLLMTGRFKIYKKERKNCSESLILK